MLLPVAFYPHAACIAKHLPHLRPSQVRGLALWVGGTILAHSGCQHAVLGTLLTLGLVPEAERQPSPWMPDLDRLGPAVPSDMTVRVLCDRGLQSPDLWAAIRRQGWHPYMRYDRHMTFQATTGPPAGRLGVSWPGKASTR